MTVDESFLWPQVWWAPCPAEFEQLLPWHVRAAGFRAAIRDLNPQYTLAAILAHGGVTDADLCETVRTSGGFGQSIHLFNNILTAAIEEQRRRNGL